MLNHIVNVIDKYLKQFSKSERKKIGQFFTSRNASVFMAKQFDDKLNKDVSILDPGAGTGILSAALTDRLADLNLNSIHIVMYENDDKIIPFLESNCRYMIEKSKIPLSIDLIKKNFILDNDFENSQNHFDLIVSNPPYRKIPKSSSEAQKMSDIIYGSPNLYFLFMAMSLNLLKKNGQMVFIIPRSWTSGIYFKKFRKYLLKNGKINSIHLFTNRNNLFKGDSILQETVIVKVSKSQNQPELIDISSSADDTFNHLEKFKLPWELAISDDDNSYIFLPANQGDVEILKRINKFRHTLSDLGLGLKTGLTVGFRNKELLCGSQNQNTVPIFLSISF